LRSIPRVHFDPGGGVIFPRLARNALSAVRDAETTPGRRRSNRADRQQQWYSFVLQACPGKDLTHVERSAHLASETVERLLPLGPPWIEHRRGRQAVIASCRVQELMAETVIIKNAVQEAAKPPPVLADTPIQLARLQGGEGLCLILIRSLADVNLVSRNLPLL